MLKRLFFCFFSLSLAGLAFSKGGGFDFNNDVSISCPCSKGDGIKLQDGWYDRCGVELPPSNIPEIKNVCIV